MKPDDKRRNADPRKAREAHSRYVREGRRLRAAEELKTIDSGSEYDVETESDDDLYEEPEPVAKPAKKPSRAELSDEDLVGLLTRAISLMPEKTPRRRWQKSKPRSKRAALKDDTQDSEGSEDSEDSEEEEPPKLRRSRTKAKPAKPAAHCAEGVVEDPVEPVKPVEPAADKPDTPRVDPLSSMMGFR